LLLALAVQAENDFSDGRDSAHKAAEVEDLLTNVKVILAGLEAYGVMWAGIDVMAGECCVVYVSPSSGYRPLSVARVISHPVPGWATADILGEVRAALEAASRLPAEIRAQIESASNSPSTAADGTQ
jgi:hypothetical protein